MAASTSNSEDIITGINITPLVDVVLVLLVMFMITAPVIYQSAIKVKLPAAKNGEQIQHVTLRVFLTSEGSTYLDKQSVTKERLTQLSKEALKRDPRADAVVSADEGLSHGKVMAIVDLLRENGISNIAVGVEGNKK